MLEANKSEYAAFVAILADIVHEYLKIYPEGSMGAILENKEAV